jgi:hypothetical protein
MTHSILKVKETSRKMHFQSHRWRVEEQVTRPNQLSHRFIDPDVISSSCPHLVECVYLLDMVILVLFKVLF